MSFRRTQIKAPTLDAMRAALPDWETMLATILEAMLERFERKAGYPFIDTKLSLLTGEDFPPAADPETDFKGPGAVFGWIQGRGLESLVGHARWLPHCSTVSGTKREELLKRLQTMIATVFEQLEKMRARNGGHLFFLMTPEGRPFGMDDHGRRRYFEPTTSASSMTDLFYVKGMLAAARWLGDDQKVREAGAFFRRISEDILARRFYSDQIGFDPKNTVAPVAGRYSHGSRMIGLGACALFAAEAPDEAWTALGVEFVQYILKNHIASKSAPGLQPFDMFEFIDDAGQPWKDASGRVVSDPGHATEFTGLAAKFLHTVEAQGVRSSTVQSVLEQCRQVLPKVLEHNFRNGFNAQAGGLCKTFDLAARAPINSDMPWWNLPETMRSAALMLAGFRPANPRPLLEIVQQCSNAFFKNFVHERVHLMAYQTVNQHGQPVDVIPATPDADPGYHTGLSIIDFLSSMRAL